MISRSTSDQSQFPTLQAAERCKQEEIAISVRSSRKTKKVNHPIERLREPSARLQVMAAAREEIRRREAMLAELAELEESVFDASLDTFESPRGAAEWLAQPAYALGGEIPLIVASTLTGRERVLAALAMIEYNTLP